MCRVQLLGDTSACAQLFLTTLGNAERLEPELKSASVLVGRGFCFFGVHAHELVGLCVKDVPVRVAPEDVEVSDCRGCVEVAYANMHHRFDRLCVDFDSALLKGALDPLFSLRKAVRG